jgi:hypothetical protein
MKGLSNHLIVEITNLKGKTELEIIRIIQKGMEENVEENLEETWKLFHFLFWNGRRVAAAKLFHLMKDKSEKMKWYHLFIK